MQLLYYLDMLREMGINAKGELLFPEERKKELDVAEIFKPIMVDRLIFTLVNKKMITKKDFDKHMEGILLSEEGRKKFIGELDKRMKTTVNHRHLGKSVSYRRLIRLELYKIQKHLLGEKEYEPYRSLW
jgi:CRISP-associated protein Cas1